MIIDPKGKLNKEMLKKSLIIFGILCAVIGIGAVSINLIYNRFVIKENTSDLANIPIYDRNETAEEADLNQNVAIFGVDKDGLRTDVIFVVNLNTTTDAIKVIAVPRDTKVAWTSYQQDKMRELGKGYHEYSKITEMSAYGGLDNLRYFTVNTLEDIMGIKIDHYAVINIDAFRKIVDAIGGVEVEVPRRMIYHDNYQDLHIDLQPGLQVLNGEQAEGLVRWRHNEDYSEQYAEGDVGRIETQQIFLKALAHKVLSSTTSADLLKMVSAIYGDIKTDIKLSELKDYIKYISQFKAENITFATLPGEAVREDKWYYILDQAEVDAFMQKIMYGRDVPIIREETETSVEKHATSIEESSASTNWENTTPVEYVPEIEEEHNEDIHTALPEVTPQETTKEELVPEVAPEEVIEPTVSETPEQNMLPTPLPTPEGIQQPIESIQPEESIAPSLEIEQPDIPESTASIMTDPTLETTDGIEEPIS